MIDKNDIKKMRDYKGHINNKMIESLNVSISQMNDLHSMISDIQEINENLLLNIAELDQENQSLNSEVLKLNQEMKILRKNETQIAEKKKMYEEMDLSVAKVTMLITQLEEREKNLCEQEQQLKRNEQEFEAQKDGIISEKAEAERLARKMQEQKNAAVCSRDIAIQERDDVKKKMEILESDLKTVNEKLNAYSEDKLNLEEQLDAVNKSKEWYYNYAINVDERIIAHFNDEKRPLKDHYKFLNDSNNLGEINIHFPDYTITPENSEKYTENDKESPKNKSKDKDKQKHPKLDEMDKKDRP